MTAPDGVEIACELSGQGPALVLVHGAGAARWGFALLRPHLERRFSVIAIDRRGRGDSGDGEPPYAIEREVADVVAVARAAPRLAGRPEGEPPLLFGHSYGGLVSAAAACEIEGLARLALYEPPMGGVLAEPSRIQRWRSLVDDGDRETALREFMSDVGGYGEAEIEAFAATPAWELRKAVTHTVPRELEAERAYALPAERLGTFEQPVLMLVGSESPDWAVRSTAAYAEAFPDVAVTTLDGEGHGASVSAPERVAAELSAFFEARQDAPGSGGPPLR